MQNKTAAEILEMTDGQVEIASRLHKQQVKRGYYVHQFCIIPGTSLLSQNRAGWEASLPSQYHTAYGHRASPAPM